MLNTFFAYKKTMAGKYTGSGHRVGGTILSVPVQSILDIRSNDKHGYQALRLLIKNPKLKNPKICEIRTSEVLEPKTDIKFNEIVKVGDLVSVSGTSKGKGFAGSVKRHGFAGGPRTHGQSDRERAPGSSGSTTTPGRVYKGKRRAGHMGVETVTIRNLEVLEVSPEKNELVVSGSVPGANKFSLIKIVKK